MEAEQWLPNDLSLEEEKQRITVPHTRQSVANSGNVFIETSFSPKRMCSKKMTTVYSVNLKLNFRSNHICYKDSMIHEWRKQEDSYRS